MIDPPESKIPITLPTKVLAVALDKWGQTGEEHLIPIIGKSMRPLIQPGDQVWIKHGYVNVRRGDVIVFLQEEKMVAHRLLRICKDGSKTMVITKGDNTSYLDSPISAHQVIGRVLKIKRGDRWISIDTQVWRIGGWLIAIGMLGWATLYGWGRKIKHWLLGKR